MNAVAQLAPRVGRSTACRALGVPRATWYRHQGGTERPPRPPRTRSSRALAPAEREQVLSVLNSDRFCDLAPAEVHATLLDEGTFLCSVRTMYRVLAENGEVRERRDQLQHPTYHKPELLATKPNHLWSWDITKLKGPGKWVYYHLYVVMDVFSRFVVGWMVASRESARLARSLIDAATERQGIEPGQLTLHADRGPSMRSKTVAELLVDLGVEKTHSRPHVSNDNPYSEAQFKTLKYDPDFPDRFGSIEHARAICRPFFEWYNKEHRHSGIAFLAPEAVHNGTAALVLEKRKLVLAHAYEKHRDRFVRGLPRLPVLPTEVWINPPTSTSKEVMVTQ
jgi:putative transposase